MPAVIDTRMTVSQAARAAGVSEPTIRAWLRTGVLPHERTPLGALIDAGDLGQVIAARAAAQRERAAGRPRLPYQPPVRQSPNAPPWVPLRDPNASPPRRPSTPKERRA